MHGLNDLNVRTKNATQLWDKLVEHDVPRKMWFHQGKHGGTSSNNFQETEHEWFDYWLYGVDNGIVDEPKVDVQREDSTWNQQENWPEVDSVPTKLYLKGGNT